MITDVLVQTPGVIKSLNTIVNLANKWLFLTVHTFLVYFEFIFNIELLIAIVNCTDKYILFVMSSHMHFKKAFCGKYLLAIFKFADERLIFQMVSGVHVQIAFCVEWFVAFWKFAVKWLFFCVDTNMIFQVTWCVEGHWAIRECASEWFLFFMDVYVVVQIIFLIKLFITICIWARVRLFLRMCTYMTLKKRIIRKCLTAIRKCAREWTFIRMMCKEVFIQTTFLAKSGCTTWLLAGKRLFIRMYWKMIVQISSVVKFLLTIRVIAFEDFYVFLCLRISKFENSINILLWDVLIRLLWLIIIAFDDLNLIATRRNQSLNTLILNLIPCHHDKFLFIVFNQLVIIARASFSCLRF